MSPVNFGWIASKTGPGPNYLMPTPLAPIVRPPRPRATDGCQENAHFPFSQVEQSFGAYPTSLCYFLPSPLSAAPRAKYSYLSRNLPLYLTFCPTTLHDARGGERERKSERKTDSNKSPVKIRAASPRIAVAAADVFCLADDSEISRLSQ